MIKTVKNLTLAVALMGACSAVADTKVEISGDAEIKYKSTSLKPSTGSNTDNNFNETEVNLYVNAVNQDGIEFHSKFVAYNGVQAEQASAADKDMKTGEAYIVAPIEGKAKVIAGLKEDEAYGTDAFWTADAYWRTAIIVPFSENFNARVVLKKMKEQEKHDGEGDQDAVVLRVDGKTAGFSYGLKHGTITFDNDSDATDGVIDEKEHTIVGGYAMGEIAGAEVAFEFIKRSSDLPDATAKAAGAKGTGYILSASKAINDKLSAGLTYFAVSDGIKGGGDFAAGEIFDGNVDSSATADTNVFVVPVSYSVNDKLTANATLITGDVLDKSATEMDIGLEYALGEVTTVSAVYAKATGDGAKAALGGDQTNMTLVLATEF